MDQAFENDPPLAQSKKLGISFHMDRKWDPILKAAKTLFLEKGIAGTSMDEVAAVAGATKRTVYNNFGSKERLVEAVFEAAADEMRLGAPALSSNADGPALSIYGRTVVLSLTNAHAVSFQRLIATERGSNEAVAAKLRDTALDVLAAPLGEWLRAGNVPDNGEAKAMVDLLIAQLTAQARLDRLLGARPAYVMNSSTGETPVLDKEDRDAVEHFVEACLKARRGMPPDGRAQQRSSLSQASAISSDRP
jgi:AcrR family transcriptional regulator